jgi:hypothetical protein
VFYEIIHFNDIEEENEFSSENHWYTVASSREPMAGACGISVNSRKVNCRGKVLFYGGETKTKETLQ